MFVGGLIPDRVGAFIDHALNDRFLDVLSTHENVHLSMLGAVQEDGRDNMGIVAPIVIAARMMRMAIFFILSGFVCVGKNTLFFRYFDFLCYFCR